MTTIDKQHLLTSRQMAEFVASGFLRFDELIPAELNALAIAEMEENRLPRGGGYAGEPLDAMWAKSEGIGAIFRLPQVQGIMQSLVGPAPLYDHHAVHIVRGQHKHGQHWHADAIIDTRLAFDVQFFYYAHDTPREMGGTMFLPGSHYRHISESDIARYHNFRNQVPMVCKAGTLAVAHHGIWHCAQPNHTDATRYMFKLRLNPTVRQLLLWNTDDMDDPQLGGILGQSHGWYGNDERIEVVNRIRLWRFITGNDKFDLAYWMGRLENEPTVRLEDMVREREMTMVG